MQMPKGLIERQHPTAAAAVEVPAPGNSYRPTYEDHQDVLGEVLAKRLKKRQENRRLNRKVAPIKQGLKRKRNINEYLEGLEDVLGIEKKSKVKEEPEQGEEPEPVLPTASSRWSVKISKTERNKLKKREMRRKTKKYKRLVKKRKRELEAIPEILQQIEQEEVEQQEYLERKRQAKEERKKKTRSLSRYSFARQPMSYLLTNELPQTLRQLPALPGYNPFKERFVSLQHRNLIEARVPVVYAALFSCIAPCDRLSCNPCRPRRRYRIKYYEPRSAKADWELSTASA